MVTDRFTTPTLRCRTTFPLVTTFFFFYNTSIARCDASHIDDHKLHVS